jgi:hypothetical protein
MAIENDPVFKWPVPAKNDLLKIGLVRFSDVG